jgi:hypothetical protein
MQDPGKHLAVPCHLISVQLREEIERGLEAPLELKELIVGKCRIEAFVLPEKLRGWLGERLPFVRGDDALCFEGRLDDRIIPVLVPASAGQVEITSDKKEDGDDEETIRKRQQAADTYQEDLKYFSCLTGKRVVLHRDAPHPCEPFQDPEGYTLHLVTGTCPPGDSHGESRRYIFGCKLEERGWWVDCRMPTRGRGVAAKDPQGVPVVQLLDDTLYILIPILTYYHGVESDLIFRGILAAAWNLRLDAQAGKVTPPEQREGADTFIAKLKEDLDDLPNVWKKEAEKSDREIERLRKELTDALRRKREMLALGLATANEPFWRGAIERVTAEERTLRDHRLVERLYVCDEGLHVETKTIVLEHEGKRYPIGRFAFRFTRLCRAHIWCIEARHPRGVPHPHMPKNGTPCLGTATEPFAKACAEYRIYDATDLVIRWLEDGYLPESADAKITEWKEEAAHG